MKRGSTSNNEYYRASLPLALANGYFWRRVKLFRHKRMLAPAKRANTFKPPFCLIFTFLDELKIIYSLFFAVLGIFRIFVVRFIE
jgi:hypothetical protein